MPKGGFGFATEADADSFTIDTQYYLCTELNFAEADPHFSATGVGGVGAQHGATGRGSGIGTAKNVHTPDGGLTWLVDLITLPAMNPQGTQTPPPTFSCSSSGGLTGGGGSTVTGGGGSTGGSSGSGGNTGKGGSSGTGGSSGGGGIGSGGSTGKGGSTGSGGVDGAGGANPGSGGSGGTSGGSGIGGAAGTSATGGSTGNTSDSSGCSCVVGSRSLGGGLSAFALLGALVLLARRRRNRT
jgi:MYXO-CTERM domain-containing protein